MDANECRTCGNTKNLQRGWTNCWYCSEGCERSHVSEVHGSMPHSGGLPRSNWVPHHLGIEISEKWSKGV